MAEICFVADGELSPSKDSTCRKVEFVLGADDTVATKNVTPSSSSVSSQTERKRRRLHHYPRRSHNTEASNQTNFEVETAKYGVTSVCGRRREMEDTVSVHPSFVTLTNQPQIPFHFFAVFDGHGCSHVSMNCENRMHEIVKEEIESKIGEIEDWNKLMQESFARMDDEVKEYRTDNLEQKENSNIICRCESQTPHHYDAVGSTALVVVVTPNKFIVANCGDCRAVLCRKSAVVPLSSDHKPDRPDELSRIESAGGRVIYWDGARVLGVLATSRAIGDGYLKPYVISEPEVVVMDRELDDEFIVLASDGLWDVISNESACETVRSCMRAQRCTSMSGFPSFGSDKTCLNASIMLTQMAMSKQSSDNISAMVIDLRSDYQK